MKSRIYLIEPLSKIAMDTKLVRAGSAAQATAHVAQNLFRVTVASQDDCVEFAALGRKVETARAEEVEK